MSTRRRLFSAAELMRKRQDIEQRLEENTRLDDARATSHSNKKRKLKHCYSTQDEDSIRKQDPSTPPESGRCCFMELPRELRLRIYNIAGSKNDEPVDFTWRAPRVPRPQEKRTCAVMTAFTPVVRNGRGDLKSAARMLQVSEQMKREVAHILYGDNTYILSSAELTREFICSLGSLAALVKHTEIPNLEWLDNSDEIRMLTEFLRLQSITLYYSDIVELEN